MMYALDTGAGTAWIFSLILFNHILFLLDNYFSNLHRI